MKKLICLFLGVAIVFALAAGCKVGIDIGPTEPTTIAVNEDDLNKARNELDLGELDALAQDALRRALELDVTIPAEDSPPQTMPPPMPAGVEVDAAEVRALMRNVLDIFGSGKFTMKTRSSSPFVAGGNTATPLTVAMDENAMAFEVEMDWASLFRSEGQSVVQARIQGATAQTLFGKKVRIVTKTDGIMIVLVDKKTYMPMGDGSAEGGELMEFDLTGAMGDAFGGAGSREEIEMRLNEIKSSKVTMGGKEYLCAELKAEGNTMRYYFQGGELKRIEADAEGESVMWEIDMLSGQVDPAFFGTAGMRAMPLDQMADLGASLGGVL